MKLLKINIIFLTQKRGNEQNVIEPVTYGCATWKNEYILLIDLCTHKKITYLFLLVAMYRCSNAKYMLGVLQKYCLPLKEPKY